MNLHGASRKYTITPGEADHSPPVRDPSVVPCSQQAEAPALVQHLRPSQGVWDFPGLDPPGCSLSHIWHLLPEDRAPPPVHTVLWLGSYSPSLPTPGAFFPWNVLRHKGGALGRPAIRSTFKSDMLLPLFCHSEEARTLCSLSPCSVIYFYLNKCDMEITVC